MSRAMKPPLKLSFFSLTKKSWICEPDSNPGGSWESQQPKKAGSVCSNYNQNKPISFSQNFHQFPVNYVGLKINRALSGNLWGVLAFMKKQLHTIFVSQGQSTLDVFFFDHLLDETSMEANLLWFAYPKNCPGSNLLGGDFLHPIEQHIEVTWDHFPKRVNMKKNMNEYTTMIYNIIFSSCHEVW